MLLKVGEEDNVMGGSVYIHLLGYSLATSFSDLQKEGKNLKRLATWKWCVDNDILLSTIAGKAKLYKPGCDAIVE